MDRYEGSGRIAVNGRQLAEAVKCTFRVKGNNNPVVTMAKQLAGKSDGATSSEATIENAVPLKGYEVDFVRHVVEKKIFTITVLSGAMRHRFEGWFEDVEWSNATDATTILTANFMAGPPKSLGG